VINDRTARVIKTIVTIGSSRPFISSALAETEENVSNLKMALIHPTLSELAQQEEAVGVQSFPQGKERNALLWEQ